MVRKRFLSLRKALWCASTVAAVVLSVLAGTSGPAGSAQAASVASSARPCDIYAGGGTPCVAAYSTVRANVTPAGSHDTISNVANGMVLDAEDCETANGTTVRQWAQLDNTCQQWDIKP